MKEKKKRKSPLFKILETYFQKLLFYTFIDKYKREPESKEELEEYSKNILNLMK